MTELAIREESTAVTHLPAQRSLQPLRANDPQSSKLVRWVEEASRAEELATRLAGTSFVPASMRGKPIEVMAAILAGLELGFQPMAALRSMDVIQGTPALRAHAMRGLVQSHGHDVELVGDPTPELVVMRGRRKGAEKWQRVKWDIPRAAKLGLLQKPEWKKQPMTMLIARATGEMCRLVASDVIFAMPYAAEELDGETLPDGRAFAEPRVTVDEVMNQAAAIEAAAEETVEAAVEVPALTAEGFKAMADNATTVEALTDALREARAAGFAQDGDELLRHFVDRRTVLMRPPVEPSPSDVCGWCLRPGHFEDDCSQRPDESQYAQGGFADGGAP